MKRVLITGASSGIGKALALKYAQQGFEVYACGRSEDKLKALEAEANNITPIIFDVTDKQQIIQATKHVPPLDHLVLNAGNCEYMETVSPFDSELFSRVINTNLLSVGYCLDVLLPKLSAGSQLGIVSSSVTFLAFTQAQAYGASKAGLDYLARSLSVDLEANKIGVSLIQPGFVETPLTDKNTFNMPNTVSPEFAAEKIFSGMQAKKHTIRFPTIFITILKLMACLPFALWRKLAISMGKK
jgi:NAD(P)-dependent dehydrogenase (short-subunit alcohol dehydrogenase family)